jgi:hypothetical protein
MKLTVFTPIRQKHKYYEFTTSEFVLVFTFIVYCISRVENEIDHKKKTLIFGIPSNFKYYSTELRTKHTLVAMVTTTVCNHFIAHRLEGI